MAEFIPPQFRLITSSRGGNKLVENGFMYDKHKNIRERYLLAM